ncbi:ROK family protein [Paenibacillus senegalensis]|uniref:ROK family protein n=1 Tax=Paenibacillus senegalensis TaxID=1465766 RepID=UPI0002881457|nr:ROK family protein [Paenibacillus senegalensis]
MAAYDSQAGTCLGIDLGGTGIKGAVVNREGELKYQLSVRTPVEEGREGILRALFSLITELMHEAQEPVAGIGIGSAGRIDPVTGTILAAANLPGCAGTPLAKLIHEKFGIPVHVDNDVNAAAIGELWAGALGDIQSFAFVALGTGVGGALVNEGRLIYGERGAAGEVGHMILKPGGTLCGCGQRGCLEQYVSGTALNRAAQAVHPEWNSHRLIQQCAEGHPAALEVIDQFVKDLSSALITLHNLLDPGAIVLGGGLTASSSVWWSRLEEALSAMSPKKSVTVRAAQAGNQAGMIGAAGLVFSRLT